MFRGIYGSDTLKLFHIWNILDQIDKSFQQSFSKKMGPDSTMIYYLRNQDMDIQIFEPFQRKYYPWILGVKASQVL